LGKLAAKDLQNMLGCIKFYKSCIERGIKPIIGCEVYIAKGSRFKKELKKGEASRLEFNFDVK